MIEILDNINRSQDYLIGLGFEVVIDEYENFRQYIVEDNCEEYYQFFRYLVDNNYNHSGYHNFVLKSFIYKTFGISITYPPLPESHRIRPEIIISNREIIINISNHNNFDLCMMTPFYHGEDFDKKFGDNFKKFFKNLNNDNKLIIYDLKCINDILDKIDCEILNELDPMLYKMFMTIFNKPKIKSTNSIHFADN